MRRVVVTPTFAAGLGVVVAAVLALQMHTVFNYASPNGTTCAVGGCGTGSQVGGHTAAGPTHPLSSPGSAATHSGSSGSGSRAKDAPASGGGGGGGSSPVAAAPQLSYQTASQADGGFAGTIVMTFKPQFAHQRWRLRFSYPSDRILTVRAGRYLHVQHSRHSALVALLSSRVHGTYPRLVRVSIEVAGNPGPPLRCSFNGHGCHFGARHAGQRGPSGRPGHKPNGTPKPTASPKPKGARNRKPANAFS